MAKAPGPALTGAFITSLALWLAPLASPERASPCGTQQAPHAPAGALAGGPPAGGQVCAAETAERIGRPHSLAVPAPADTGAARLAPGAGPGTAGAGPAGQPGIELLGALVLAPGSLEPAVHGLSALAWDADAERLYALSDLGHLVHLRPLFEDGRLVDVALLGSYPLRDAAGEPLRRPHADSEALVLEGGDNGRPGDSSLLVSFEGEPRLARFRPDGHWLRDEALPPPLDARAAYAGDNLGLEAMLKHPVAGLLFGPEQPLAGAAADSFTLYGANGGRWSFAREDPRAGSLTDLALTPEGGVLILERRFRNVFLPLEIVLSTLQLEAEPDAAGRLPLRKLAHFDNSAGWAIDNFEGLARHRGRHYFMVSDDNRNPLQKTLLVYFALRSPAGTALSAPSAAE